MNIYNLLMGEITERELLNYYNACITYIVLPYGINGFIFQYKGIYNIFINDNLSDEEKKKTILHELAHIELNQLNQINNDLFEFNIMNYEDEANKYIKYILEEFAKNNEIYN